MEREAKADAAALGTNQRHILPSTSATVSTVSEDNQVCEHVPDPNDECFVCRKRGHWAKDCPKKAKCFNCWMQGHWAKDCPETAKCFNCQKRGHWAKDCPEIALLPRIGCVCGKGICRVLMARTAKNCSRKFYICPLKEEDSGCKFFLWCDITPPAEPKDIIGKVKIRDGKTYYPAPYCPCGAGKCFVKIQGTGEYIGYCYYKCPVPKSMGEGCGFTMWCDTECSFCSKCGKEGHGQGDCPFMHVLRELKTPELGCL